LNFNGNCLLIAFETSGFMTWLEKLAAQIGYQVKTLDEYKAAIVQNIDRFEGAAILK